MWLTRGIELMSRFATRARIFGPATIRGFLPLSAGLIVSLVLIVVAEVPNTPLRDTLLDPNSWYLQKYSIVKDVLLLGILIFGNFFTIFISVLYYQADINKCSRELGQIGGDLKRGSVSLAAISNGFAMAVVAVWLAGFCVLCLSPPSKNSYSISFLLNVSGVFSLVIFSLFWLEDHLLYSGLRANRIFLETRAAAGDSIAAIASKRISALEVFARDSVYFIDVPSVVASIGILLIAASSADFSHVANGVTERAYDVLPHEMFRQKTMPFNSAAQSVNELIAPVAVGISAGAHLMQLFFSQFVFALLSTLHNLRDGPPTAK